MLDFLSHFWREGYLTGQCVLVRIALRNGIPRIPPDLELRDYQNTAIISWFRNRGRGTLKMATGSGKTITALAINVLTILAAVIFIS